MSDALQRTVRRETALLSLPLCGLLVGTQRYVWSDVYGASPPTAWELVLYVVAPVLVAAGASLYLVGSGCYSLGRWLDPDPEGAEESA